MTTLARFDIHQPASALEACRTLAKYPEEAGLYAGGTELLLAMKHQALSYRHLVDLKVIPGLDAIALNKDSIEIGATATHRSIERSALVRKEQPVLAELESKVANVRVRATGTLGGNICFAEPHSDPATLLLVLGATVILEGLAGTRQLTLDKFIAGPYTTRLQPQEILRNVVVPIAKQEERIAYMKFQVRERPMLGLALLLTTPDGGRTVTRGRVAVGCACPSPTRVPAAEDLLAGPRAEVEERLPQAAEAIADAADLVDDHEGSANYKRHLIHVFLGRVFRKALDSRPSEIT